jgi:hypothetical protein
MSMTHFRRNPSLSSWPPGCSRRLLLSQKCTARHAEYDEQARISIACYIIFDFCIWCLFVCLWLFDQNGVSTVECTPM